MFQIKDFIDCSKDFSFGILHLETLHSPGPVQGYHGIFPQVLLLCTVIQNSIKIRTPFPSFIEKIAVCILTRIFLGSLSMLSTLGYTHIFGQLY